MKSLPKKRKRRPPADPAAEAQVRARIEAAEARDRRIGRLYRGEGEKPQD